VSTGDPIPLDWTIWSNFLWFRDFHQITEGDENRPLEKKKSKDDEFNFDEDFKSTLKSFLVQMMPQKINYTDMLGFSIDNYLFEKVDIVLIASAPGRYRDKDFDKFGSRKIGLVLRKLIGKSMDSKHDYMLTYQTNSFGNLNEKFLKEFLGSVFPNFINIDELKAERRYKKTLTPSGNELYRRVRVVFPTKEFIDKSIEGPEYSGCLALSSDCYHNNSFPKNIFYKYETSEKYSLYPGIIPHHNMFAVTNMKGEINDDTYMYFGSHNLSAAAWGKYEKDYGQLSINNFEFGVLIPPGKGKI
jgi:tyrosyl-DNA phosphodiesterase-1